MSESSDISGSGALARRPAPSPSIVVVSVGLSLAVGLTAAPREARAEGEGLQGPRTLVIRSGIDGADLVDRLADALIVTLRAEGIDVRLPVRPQPPPDETEALARAIESYENLRPREAREAVEALLARADRTGGRGLTRADLVRALMVLASSARVLGDDEAVGAALDRALVIDPDLELSPSLYPPWLRELLDARRGLRGEAPAATLVVQVRPAGARLYIDGRALPAGTERLVLAAGPHLVRVTADAFVPFGRRVELEAGENRLEVELRPDHRAVLARPGAPGEPVDGLEEAGRALGAPVLLVEITADEEGPGFEVTARDLATGRRAAVTAPEGEAPEAVAAHLVEGLNATGVEFPAPEPADRGRRRRAVWIASGTAAAVVVAVLVGVLAAAPWDDEDVVEGRWRR